MLRQRALRAGRYWIMTINLLLASALVSASALVVSTATAQTMPKGPTPTNQTTQAGAAGVSSRLQSQGYSQIHNLHRGPDGKWVGEATRNGVRHTVTANPDGSTTAR
jgi:hypothetical protein